MLVMKLLRPALVTWTWCPLALGLETQKPALVIVTPLFSTLLIEVIYVPRTLVMVSLEFLQEETRWAVTELLVPTATLLIPVKQELARARVIVPLDRLPIYLYLTPARERLLTNVLKLEARLTILPSA